MLLLEAGPASTDASVDLLSNVTFSSRSNNLENAMKKRQYWIREEGHWKIIYEGAA